jgi:hypothetical protein
MSNLRYLCFSVNSGVQHILCCVFVLFSYVFVPYVASFSGLSIFDCSFGIFQCLFTLFTNNGFVQSSTRLGQYN